MRSRSEGLPSPLPGRVPRGVRHASWILAIHLIFVLLWRQRLSYSDMDFMCAAPRCICFALPNTYFVEDNMSTLTLDEQNWKHEESNVLIIISISIILSWIVIIIWSASPWAYVFWLNVMH